MSGSAINLIAEYRALKEERQAITQLCLKEFATMSYQTAKLRGERLDAIGKRLAAIVRSRAWKALDPGKQKELLDA